MSTVHPMKAEVVSSHHHSKNAERIDELTKTIARFDDRFETIDLFHMTCFDTVNRKIENLQHTSDAESVQAQKELKDLEERMDMWELNDAEVYNVVKSLSSAVDKFERRFTTMSYFIYMLTAATVLSIGAQICRAFQ